MDMANPSLVTGIFRDQANADRAMLELQRAGVNADQITVTGYNLTTLQETQDAVDMQPDSRLIVVTVQAGDKTREATHIFVTNGANNADLPPGIVLDQGRPVRVQRETEPETP